MRSGVSSSSARLRNVPTHEDGNSAPVSSRCLAMEIPACQQRPRSGKTAPDYSSRRADTSTGGLGSDGRSDPSRLMNRGRPAVQSGRRVRALVVPLAAQALRFDVPGRPILGLRARPRTVLIPHGARPPDRDSRQHPDAPYLPHGSLFPFYGCPGCPQAWAHPERGSGSPRVTFGPALPPTTRSSGQSRLPLR